MLQENEVKYREDFKNLNEEATDEPDPLGENVNVDVDHVKIQPQDDEIQVFDSITFSVKITAGPKSSV